MSDTLRTDTPCMGCNMERCDNCELWLARRDLAEAIADRDTLSQVLAVFMWAAEKAGVPMNQPPIKVARALARRILPSTMFGIKAAKGGEVKP